MKSKNIFFFLLTFLVLAIYFQRIYPTLTVTDNYYHLAVGRQIYQDKKISNGDYFTYGVDNSKINSNERLSGFAFYIFYRFLGGNVGTYILRIITTILTMFVLFKTLRLFDEKGKNSIILATITGYVLSIRINDRPEIFSYLFLSIINYFCLNYFFKKKYSRMGYLVFFIFLIWPNIHGYVSIGLVIFAFFAALAFIETNLTRLADSNYQKFLITFLLSSVGALVQYQRLTTFTLESKFALIIGEWVSLIEQIHNSGSYIFLQLSITLYLLTTFTFLFLFIYYLKNNLNNFKKENIKYVFVFAFYFFILLAAIKYIRLIQALFLIVIPVLLLLINKTQKKLINVKRFLGIIYLIVLAYILFSIVTGSLIEPKIIAFIQQKTSKKALVTYWGGSFPEKAPRVINGYLNTKRLFTSNYWNSYFIWTTPKAKVFSDVIFENVTAEDISNDLTLTTGKKGWEDLLEKYAIDTVVNSQPDASWANFTPVQTLPNWQLIYLDNIETVYARKDIIKTLPVDLDLIQPQLTTDLKFFPKDEYGAVSQLKNLIIFDPTNDFARVQLILYYRDKNLALAKQLATESRQILPKNPWFSYLLTSISARENDCHNAQLYGKEAIDKSFNDSHIKTVIETMTAKCSGKPIDI